MKSYAIAAAVVACLALPGCGTAPPVVVESSNQAVSMLSQLGQEVQQFRNARIAGDELVLKLSGDTQLRTEVNRALVVDLLEGEEIAGNGARVTFYRALRDRAKALQDSDAELAKLEQTLDAELSALLKPLPDIPTKLSAESKAARALGQDLSSRTQLDETLAYLRAVRDQTKDTRQKLKDALK